MKRGRVEAAACGIENIIVFCAYRASSSADLADAG